MVEARATIAAPPAVVWEVLMDMGRYAEWSTLLHAEMTTAPQLGAVINLRLSMPGGPAYSFAPEVIILDANQHFAWRQKTVLPGIFDGEHHFLLTPVGAAATDLYNYERYKGFLSPIIRRLPMMQTAAGGFETMNDEIRHRSEHLYAKGNAQ